jgi:hypothetical protein
MTEKFPKYRSFHYDLQTAAFGKTFCHLQGRGDRHPQNCAIGEPTRSSTTGDTHTPQHYAGKGGVAWFFSWSAFGVLVVLSLGKPNQNSESKGAPVRYFAKCRVGQKSRKTLKIPMRVEMGKTFKKFCISSIN